jgi:hypothetical protein
MGSKEEAGSWEKGKSERGRSEGEESDGRRGGKGKRNRNSLVSRRNRVRRNSDGGREVGGEGNIRRGLTKAEKEKRDEEERRDEKG